MRKILVILFVFTQSFVVYCQTFQPSQTLINYGGPKLLDTCTDFKENNFVIGWHWYQSYKMSQAQDINMIHVDIQNDYGYADPDAYHMAHNARMIMNLPCIGHNNRDDNNFVISNNIAIQYEPTYKVDTSNPGATFIQRKYDTTRYAFGFVNIRGFIDTAKNSANYNRLQLFNVDSIRGDIVLSEPWMNNGFSCLLDTSEINLSNNFIKPTFIGNIYNKPNGAILTIIDTISNKEWKGVNFYLNINLRRLDSLDQTINNDTILEIRMPYVTLGSQNTGYIRFDSLPCKDYNSTYFLPYGRGLVRYDTISTNDSVLYITRNMIPAGYETDRDINLSAHFICDNNFGFPLYRNYFLKGVPKINDIPIVPLDKQIDQLKIEVKYRGNCNVGIDWISINTRPTRELGMGFFDNTIKNKIQECLDQITSNPSYSSYNIKPFRWYLTDEAPPTYWFTRHYFTKLIGKVFTMEGCQTGTHYIGMPQYKYYCNIPEVWLGSGGLYAWMAVPYIPDVLPNTDTVSFKNLGWGLGYRHIYHPDSIPQHQIDLIKNSQYETMRYCNFYEPFCSGGYGNSGHGTQLNFELSEIYMFENRENQFLFDSLPWWEQTWNDQRYTFDTVKVNDTLKTFIHGDGGRILTGEEIRYFFYKAVLDGAKGYIMDGEDEFPDHGNGAFNLHFGQNIIDGQTIIERLGLINDSSWVFLNRNEIGGDYLNLTDPNEDLRVCFNMDTVSKYLHIDRDKYYVGRKSVRKERYKIAEWIRACESEIMPLKLVAMYSKGFQKLYVQDPKLTEENILSKYINLDSIKTRFPGRSTFENHTIIDNHEVDSGFYHLTLLKNKNSPNLDSCFFLGVLNKRVGPHIVYDSADVGKKDSIAFITTADLDTNLIFNQTQRKKYFWRKLGTREMEIKFNYVPENPDYPDEYDLLRITEIGYDNTSLNQKPWRQPDYYSIVDTVIGQDGTLKMKLLAGEGKILKVTVLRPPKINGNLAHSNQSKLVCYPVLDANGNETSAYRYHLVYFKPLPSPDSLKNGVYYRRSKKITKDCPEENIQWEPEKCLSDNIYDTKSDSTRLIHYKKDSNQISCDYPSIVLRNNSSNNHLYAYVVYSCASCDQLITETMIDLFDDTTSVKQGNVLSKFNGVDHAEWGNPVINSSYANSPTDNLNYYAWSDSTKGIVTACKYSRETLIRPDTTYTTYTTFIYKYKLNIHWNVANTFAKHPSFNVYSHTSNGAYNGYEEDNCALVWQESLPNYPGQIYYTRLRFINTNYTHILTNYLPPAYQDPIRNHVTCNSNNTIAALSDMVGSYINTFPVIYRNLDYVTSSGATSNRFDRVYWESRGQYSYIALRPIDLLDNNNSSINWSVNPVSLIRMMFYDLTQPDITQGYHEPNIGTLGNGMLLDMKHSAAGWSHILQLPHTLTSLIGTYYYWYAYNIQEIADIGNLPHLSKHYKMMSENQSWLTRRVYNLFDPNPPSILTSAKFSYRQNEDNQIDEGLVGFRSSYSNYFIYLPSLNDRKIGLYLPFIESTDSLGNTQLIRIPCDTIFSDWFTVGDVSTLNFKCKGYDTTKTQMLIQKYSNGQIYNLDIPELTPDTLGKLCCNLLLNGMDNEYRLLMINRDTTNSSYSEEVWIGGLPVDTMLFLNKAGVNVGYNIVDLGGGTNDEIQNQNMTLSVHPNPANDVVYVNGLLPVSVYLDNGNTNVNHKIKYSVYSQIGCVQMTAEGTPGETVSINTNDLPAGVYFIRAEHKSDNYYNPVSPVVEPFVISR